MTKLETGINIIEWPSLQYCTMSAFGGDALQRKAMSHKPSFIIIYNWFIEVLGYCLWMLEKAEFQCVMNTFGWEIGSMLT